MLRSLGAPAEEVNYILAEKRREVLSGKELEKFEEETVLAQLGVEKPDEKDEEETAEEDDATPAMNDEGAVVDSEKIEVGDKSMVKGDTDATISPDTKEVVKPKEPAEELKPLVKQVVEANMSPEPKKKESQADSEEAESSSEPEIELREKSMEPL